ncbi:protein msta-like isoform X2 [Cimex lectularius]|uniref:SET domain-containing protein n=1 Tax=Cimex lectularius TaxID=79782 RepID=A0A8I6SKJ0_CIMLE|nr:protein msta-like isoform X2 [Cimex lectularius]
MSDINELLMKKNPLLKDVIWEVRNTKYAGQGLFAKRNVENGEIIFKEVPIVVGPRMTGLQLTACIVCCSVKKPLRKCFKNCHLPVCSSECENSPEHDKECKVLRQILINDDLWSLKLYHILTQLRCLLVEEEDREIIKKLHANSKESVRKEIYKIKEIVGDFLSESDEEWIEHCCGVLNSTAYEITFGADTPLSLRGLYPLAAIMNHDCSPNTRHFYSKEDPFMMIVVATKRIAQGEEITNTYCPLLWATNSRRVFLHMTKEFLCRCLRCQDPTEFGSYLSAFWCKCGGTYLPILPLNFHSKWKCDKCNSLLNPLEVSQIQSNIKKLSVEQMESILHPNNTIVAQFKMEAIRSLGERIEGTLEQP